MPSNRNSRKRDSGPHRVGSRHRYSEADRNRIPICVLLPENVLLLDVAGIVEPFRIANWWSAKQKLGPRFELRFFGARPAVCCSLGLSLGRLEPLPRALPPDAWLIVPGVAEVSTTLARLARSSVVRWLASVGTTASRRLTVCSGALLAAHAGWLNGRSCTTHHDLLDTLREIAPLAKVLENRIFVVDESLATSAGITAGIDLALWAVGEVLGPAAALGVAREMVVHARREGGDPQISSWLQQRNHLHPAVHRVQDAIAHSPAEPWTLARMAAIAYVGERQLARLFRQYAGGSPLDYMHRVRLEAFDKLMADAPRSIESAATAVGYSSAQQFRRVWRRQRKGLPRRDIQ